jgi:uncharacterized membrane protein
MMERERIYALFRNFEDAASAINELTAKGLDPSHISVVTRDTEGRFARYVDSDDVHVDSGEGAGFGATMGALVGLGVMAIPGIGPVMAAGPLAAALTGLTTGAIAGAATGGLVGALMEMGAEEEEATYYRQTLIDGGALVIVDHVSENWDDTVEAVFTRNNAIDVEDYDLT